MHSVTFQTIMVQLSARARHNVMLSVANLKVLDVTAFFFWLNFLVANDCIA